MAASPSPARRATIRALAAPLVLVLLVFALTPAAAQDEGEGGGEDRLNAVIDITFPLSGETFYSDTYDACRSGCSRLHRATDMMADKMVPIHAVVDGEICFITGIDEPPPHYGYMIRLCGDDGLRYSYVHINNDTPGTDDGQGGTEYAYAEGIVEGVRVTRGQHIAYVGDSGNAEGTGSHLHFEIFDADYAETEWQGRINPYHSLIAAEERGDYPTPPEQAAGPPDEVGEPEQEQPEQEQPEQEQPEQPAEPADPPAAEEEPEQPADPAPQPDSSSDAVDVTRLAGSTRIGTALALARAGWAAESRAVIVVPADSYSEALVAAPLAGLIDSPVVLAGPGGLEADALAEIRRLAPLSAYIIGDTEQLPEQVEADLEEAGVRFLARLSAPNRFALSALVAEEIASYEDDPVIDEVVLALGEADDESRAWPDALSASALAAHAAVPVLLTRGDQLPDEIADLLTEWRPGRITVVGGTAAIRQSTVDEAAELADATIERLAGATRYDTSVAVAEAGFDAGLTSGNVLVATGLNFPDALAAGPAAARLGAPLVLVHGLDPNGAPTATSWLKERANGVLVVGGNAVVTDEVAAAVRP